jgi:hypothetical protein
MNFELPSSVSGFKPLTDPISSAMKLNKFSLSLYSCQDGSRVARTFRIERFAEGFVVEIQLKIS